MKWVEFQPDYAYNAWALFYRTYLTLMSKPNRSLNITRSVYLKYMINRCLVVEL